MIELYLLEYKIDGRRYGSHIPARSWKHAGEIATRLHGAVDNPKITGSNISQMSCIPAHQLMAYIEAVTDEVKWKYNAIEQLEAFLAMDWPAEPEEAQ